MSGDLTPYERAMREAIERDIPTILALDGDVVDSPLSSIEYAVMKTGDAAAADSHRDPLARARMVASMERIRGIPNPEPPPPPPPLVKATRLRINTMEPGVRYRVVQSFETFDGDTIDEGVVLTFQGYSYFPYDGGYTIQFAERGFRLAEISDANNRVLANEGNVYFAPADD
jgi:Domain of unknown function (DUF3601)